MNDDVREGDLMGAKGFEGRIRGAASGAALFVLVFANVVPSSPASAAGRSSFIAVTHDNTGVVLLALVGGLLVLVGIGTVAFTLARKRRRPSPCAEEREALALAEKAVQYWEAVRAHVVAVEAERLRVDGADSHDATHASQLTRAVEGLSSAMKQRDDCEMALIHCMASGMPSTPIAPTLMSQQPFFIPGTDSPPPASPEAD